MNKQNLFLIPFLLFFASSLLSEDSSVTLNNEAKADLLLLEQIAAGSLPKKTLKHENNNDEVLEKSSGVNNNSPSDTVFISETKADDGYDQDSCEQTPKESNNLSENTGTKLDSIKQPKNIKKQKKFSTCKWLLGGGLTIAGIIVAAIVIIENRNNPTNKNILILDLIGNPAEIEYNDSLLWKSVTDKLKKNHGQLIETTEENKLVIELVDDNPKKDDHVQTFKITFIKKNNPNAESTQKLNLLNAILMYCNMTGKNYKEVQHLTIKDIFKDISKRIEQNQQEYKAFKQGQEQNKAPINTDDKMAANLQKNLFESNISTLNLLFHSLQDILRKWDLSKYTQK